MTTRCWRCKWCGLLAAVVALAAAGLAAPAAVATSLVLPTSSLQGLHSVPASSLAARLDLFAGLRATGAAVQIQTAAAAGHGIRLRSDAFVFKDAAAAQRVLSSWRRVHRARPARTAGGGGFVFAIGHGSTATVDLAWRDGARIGVLVLRARGAVPATVVQYAPLADQWLRSPLPATAWDRVLDQIRPDGTLPVQAALEGLALAYGPVPGVHAPSGPRTPIRDATDVTLWVGHYLPRLTRAQQHAAERLLGIPPPGVAVAHAADWGDPNFTQNAVLQKTAEDDVGKYEAVLHHTLGLKLVVGATTTKLKTKSGGNAWANAWPFNAEGKTYSGTPAYCRIRVGQSGLNQSEEIKSLIIAHELFHCFQFDLRGKYAWNPSPDWITEGSADWAAATIEPSTYSVLEHFLELKTYVENPHRSLFQRVYDGAFFWGHLEDVTSSVWNGLKQAIIDSADRQSFVDSGADNGNVLDTWASGMLRLPGGEGGAPWHIDSPVKDPENIPNLGSLPTQVDPFNGDTVLAAPPYTLANYQLKDPPKDRPLMHVTLSGWGRLSAVHNYTLLSDAWFCLYPTECRCPPGTIDELPSFQPLEPDAYLALTGDPDQKGGTEAHIRFVAVDQFCQSRQPSPPPGGTASGFSNGDPYIGTFDGGHYGFQTAGEFTLLKSTVDDLEIQSRQVPYRLVLGPQWGNSLAMNTAFAMRDGGAVVEVDRGSPLVLYIDRHRRRARSGEVIALPGGGTVTYYTTQVIVSWADGTSATVFSIGSEGVNVYVRPSRSRAGRLRGLLGSDDGKLADDFIGRTGRRYNPKLIQRVGLIVATRAQVRVVLGGFGRSWRITQGESLFVYPPGKSTRSYLVPGFPRALLSVQALPPRRRVAAAQACHQAGVTNSSLLLGCEVDFGATGDHQLAISARALQHAAGLPPAKVDLSGRWSGQYSGAFTGTFTLTWKQTGSNLNGTIKLSNPRDTLSIHGTVSGTGIKFGSVGFATYSGSLFGNVMSGHYNTPRGGGSWSATKIT